MAADERTVDRIIAETLDRHGGEDSGDPDVWEAQNELYDRRTYDPALAGDENYIIAEHYMLSRALVATGQLPVEQLLAQVDPRGGGPRDAGTAAFGLVARKVAEGANHGEAQRLRTGRPKPDANPRAVVIINAFEKILRR